MQVQQAGQAQILQGDAIEMLRTLDDESVQCVVTSPPYFGLRDYGTAEWDGAADDCDHIQQYTNPQVSACSGGITNKRPDLEAQQTASQNGRKQFREQCGKCGATRIDQQIGLEPTPAEYIEKLVAVFREVRRVLRKDGTAWVNIGDSYASSGSGSWGSSDKSTLTTGSRKGAWAPGNTIGKIPPRQLNGLKPKDLMGMPWRLAFALQADGWYLRQDIIWHKPNPMPESVTDRCTKAHEYIFLLSKSERYFYDAAAIAEESAAPGSIHVAAIGQKTNGQQGIAANIVSGDTRNKRSVWTITTEPFSAAPFLGGAGDGNGRTVSPDCPIHGERRSAASTAQCDAPRAASPIVRNSRTYAHPDQSQLVGLFPTETHHGAHSVPDSLGLPVQSCSVLATSRSKENHRMDLAPATLPREIGAAGLAIGTADSSQLLELGATSARIHESNNEPDCAPDATAMRPSVQTQSSSADRCTCKIIDHFAVFPTELPRLCILAGSRLGDTILDPFAGSGTTLQVALELGRSAIGIELNAEYVALANRRLNSTTLGLPLEIAA